MKKKKRKQKRKLSHGKASRRKGVMQSLFATPQSRHQFKKRQMDNHQLFAKVQKQGFDDGAHVPSSNITYATKSLSR